MKNIFTFLIYTFIMLLLAACNDDPNNVHSPFTEGSPVGLEIKELTIGAKESIASVDITKSTNWKIASIKEKYDNMPEPDIYFPYTGSRSVYFSNDSIIGYWYSIVRENNGRSISIKTNNNEGFGREVIIRFAVEMEYEELRVIQKDSFCIPQRESSRGNPVHFYFVNENGKDLVNIDDERTYPVVFEKRRELPEIQPYDSIFNNTRYGINELFYDEEEGLYTLMFSFPVVSGQTFNELNLGQRGDTNWNDLYIDYYTFRYYGYGPHYSMVKGMYLNGEKFYSEMNEGERFGKIFFIKNGDKFRVSSSKP